MRRGYFERLEDHLLLGIERRQKLASRRVIALFRPLRVGKRLGRPPRLAVLAVLLVASGSAIAAATIPGKPSLPLNGSVSRNGSRFQYRVQFAPLMYAGMTGWCSYVSRAAATPRGPAASCGNNGAISPAEPLYSWMNVGALQVVLTSPQVAAVRVLNGPTVTTLSEGVPFGLRAAVFPVPRGLAERPNPLRMLVALNASGHTIPASNPNSGAPLPTAVWLRPPGSLQVLASLGIDRTPSGVLTRVPSTPCVVAPSPTSGVIALGGVVATKVAAVAVPIAGRAFVDCDDTVVSWAGSDFRASLLLDAAHPGSRPASIPTTQPVAGDPGAVFSPAVIPTVPRAPTIPLPFQGMVARRVGNAWLVVQGGTTTAQRLHVLSRLDAESTQVHSS